MSDYLSPSLRHLNEQFVDVNFIGEYGPELCGCIPGIPAEVERYGVPYGSVMPVYTKTELIDIIKRMDAEDAWRTRLIKFKKNQGREGTCVYNMGAHIVQNAQAIQWGLDNVVPLSPISGYRWNAPNAQSGSTVEGCIRWLTTKGLLPTNTHENIARFEHTHPDTGYYNRFQSGWETTAVLFLVDEWMYCKTPEEWWSSIVNGHGCGGGRDGHAIGHFALGLDGNRILSIYLQSWYVPWGFSMDTANGPLTSFGADTEAKVRTMVARNGWAVRTLRRPPFIK